MEITSAQFMLSVADQTGIILDDIPEFAFVGRSNVGKSSLINMLTRQKRLAKSSQTPGLTKLINYFSINDNAFRFVDLPGYGYAKVGKGMQDVWSSLMGQYLLSSQSLVTVFVLVDIRIPLQASDKQMLEFLFYHKLPFCVIATKADKLSRAAANRQIDALAKSLNLRKELIIPVSSQSGQGRDRILEYIEVSCKK